MEGVDRLRRKEDGEMGRVRREESGPAWPAAAHAVSTSS